ncbi:OFA family MFS transporter [Candidatus Galacturonibacter soehngenii]|uniref:OFA family MFS transporter n=1 Tax=Candidatus Galacturonatibacter soehngenii TaxID=2307010 RepID=A0A7V7QKP9_9FIRM|nr:OFA family MFS transporter [Candidatus Galacturonibacter soehngenii]KAB1438432.1 OFA family MFS transporter [Candidatus Galacturonibacter soehngenii]
MPREKNLNITRWLVLCFSCLINLCIGSLYAWSVFANPMAEYLNQTNGQALTSASMAIVFTVANAVGPITMISGGWLNERLGTKVVVLIGGLLFGGGMILSAFANSVTYLVFSYGILDGLGMGMVYGCTITNSVKFFPDKRGLIGGLTTATYGLSSVMVPPIANQLIESQGVTNAFFILGIVFLVLISIGSFFIEKCPENYIPHDMQINDKKEIQKQMDKDWKEMLKSPVFYCMILMLVCGAFGGLMCISQVSPIAQNMIGLSASAATTAISILALFNAGGRVGAGYLSDKIGRINTLTLSFVLSFFGFICLLLAGEGNIVLFYVAIAIIGICFGSFMGIFPGFTADQFGAKYNSVNYGYMFIGFALAGIFGPMTMGKLYVMNQSYKQSFLAAGALSIAGLLISVLYRNMVKKDTAQHRYQRIKNT